MKSKSFSKVSVYKQLFSVVYKQFFSGRTEYGGGWLKMMLRGVQNQPWSEGTKK